MNVSYVDSSFYRREVFHLCRISRSIDNIRSDYRGEWRLISACPPAPEHVGGGRAPRPQHPGRGGQVSREPGPGGPGALPRDDAPGKS